MNCCASLIKWSCIKLSLKAHLLGILSIRRAIKRRDVYMRHITFKWSNFIRYSVIFIFISVCLSILFMLYFTPDWRNISNLKIHIESIELVFITLIYIAFPYLLLRFVYYFYQLLMHGRKDGISLFCYQTLFNPINFLFRPSLLTQTGLVKRRRCIISLILMGCLYGYIYAISNLTA